MEQSEALDQLAPALVKAQSQIERAKEDRANPHFRNKYATLNSVWDACKEALTSNGFSVVQGPCSGAEGFVGLSTMLLHSSGQWVKSTCFVRLAKDDPQGAGSGLTYLRRYGLSAMVGVCAGDDDDGNAGSYGPDERRQSQPRQQSRANGHSDPPRQPESSGDRAAARAEAAPSGGGTATTVADPAGLRCSNTQCMRTLTRGQHDVSVRTFGQPLCPACQKQKTS